MDGSSKKRDQRGCRGAQGGEAIAECCSSGPRFYRNTSSNIAPTSSMYVAAAVSNEGDFGNSPGGGLFYGDPAWRSSSPELDGSGLFANELCNAVSDVTPRDAVHYTEGYRFHNRSTRGLFIKEIHLYAVPLTKPKTSTSDPLWVTLTLMKAYSRLILWLLYVWKRSFITDYLPQNLYSLHSSYGSESMLKALLHKMRQHKVHPMADIVINHHIGTTQGHGGRYNRYDGISLSWDERAIVFSAGVSALIILTVFLRA